MICEVPPTAAAPAAVAAAEFPPPPECDSAKGKAFRRSPGTCALDKGSTNSGPVRRPKLRQKCKACI